jgi:hypothetical protein
MNLMITRYVTLTKHFLGYYIEISGRDLLHVKLMLEGSSLAKCYCHWYDGDEIIKQKNDFGIRKLELFNQQALDYDHYEVEKKWHEIQDISSRENP